MAKGSHLELDSHQAQLLYRPGPADVAVADECHWFAIEFREHVVHRVLERSRVTVVVLAGDDDETVGAFDGSAKTGHVLVGVVPQRTGRRNRTIVKRQRMVPKVHDLEIEVVTAPETIRQPRNWFVRESARPGATDNHLDEWHQAEPIEEVDGAFCFSADRPRDQCPTSRHRLDLVRSSP